MSLTLEKIQAAAAADRIKWRYHALQRARANQRRNHRENPDEQQPPKCLLMAEVHLSKPLYVSLAYDEVGLTLKSGRPVDGKP